MAFSLDGEWPLFQAVSAVDLIDRTFVPSGIVGVFGLSSMAGLPETGRLLLGQRLGAAQKFYFGKGGEKYL